MTTLEEEIMQNISDYRMESVIAEEAVIKANMDATMRYMTIQEECDKLGIVMEGDIIPERNGENLFKYIVLFIPRLIANIFRKIREWITGIHEPTEAEIEAENQRAALDDLSAAITQQVCTIINIKIRRNFPKATTEMTFNSSKGYITRVPFLGDPDALVQAYTDKCNAFYNYLFLIKHIEEHENDYFTNPETSEAVENVLEELAQEANKSPNDGVFGYTNSSTSDIHTFKQYNQLYKKTLDPVCSKIENLNKEINKSWNRFTSDDTIPAGLQLKGNKLVDLAMKTYNSFVLMDDRVRQELDAQAFAFYNLKNTAKKVRERAKNMDQETEKDLKEKGVLV